MDAQSGQTRRGRCEAIGVSVVLTEARCLSATAAGRSAILAFALFGGVVEPGVLGRDAAFGLVGVVRGAADVADGSVGALTAPGTASLGS